MPSCPSGIGRRGALEIAGSADLAEEEDAVVALEDWVHSGAD